MRKSGIAFLGLGLVASCGLAQRAEAQYCDASSGYTACNTAYEFISNVTFGSINNSSACDAAGYEDYTGLTPASVMPGQTIPISVTIGTPFQADQCVVWVDWDASGTFDANEATVLAYNPYPTFVGNVPVPASAVVGNTRMRVRLTYAQTPLACGNSGNYGNIEDYTITVAPQTNPLITGNSASGAVGVPLLLTAVVVPGQSPPSGTLTVSGDLSSIGGPGSQAFYDDGTHGDATAGDHTFSYLYQVPHAPNQNPGSFTVPVSVVDNLSRSGTGSIAVVLGSEPVGSCCTSGVCSVTSAFTCASGGGHYMGDGTNCTTPAYVFTNSNTPFTSIVGNGGIMTGTSSNVDDGTELLNLPFSFQFFENAYSSVYVCSNGNLQFGNAPSTAWNNDAIPTAAAPNNAIYPMLDDLNTATGGDIYYATSGTSPNQTFTVEWNNVSQYIGNGGGVTSENFQVVLFEGSNNIEFRYGNISAPCNSGANQCVGQGFDGDDRTVGVENIDGTVAFSIGGATLGTGNLSKRLTYTLPTTCGPACGTADFNCDGDVGTDQDITGFFACLSGSCPAAPCTNSADFDGNGDVGTDQDIEAFFRVLGGGHC